MAQIIGTPGADTLTGTALNDGISGGGGDDIIDGGLGNDSLNGGAGNDTIYAYDGIDTVTGGDGNDTIYTHLNWALGPPGKNLMQGPASIDGGAGADTLVIDGAGSGPLTLNWSGIHNIETIKLTAGVHPLLGLDSFDAGGTFTVIGGAGIDFHYGNAAHMVYVADATSASTGVNVIGGALSDTLSGATGADQLNGGDGNDVLSGKGGNDTLIGGLGNDTLDGGGNNDILIGGGGQDTLTGGLGQDRFVFNAMTDYGVPTDSTLAAPDTITDFAPGDKIDLSGIDAYNNELNDQAFRLVFNTGTVPPTSVPVGVANITYDTVHNITVIELNNHTGTTPQAEIVLDGVLALHASDFIL